MRSPRERALWIVLAAALLAAATAAWWTSAQWAPHAGPWAGQAWRKLTRPGPETLPLDKRTASSAGTPRAARGAASAPAAPRKCLRDGHTTYTDQPCPPGSQEQAVDGAVTSVPAP